MPRTSLAECARCHVLVHRPADEPYGCPRCGRALTKGLVKVGFADAREVIGEPGAPYREPAPVVKPPREGRLKCADGHMVRTEPERRIDDWLHARGILHEVEPKMKGMRPDWRVGNVYIEYWGLAGQQGYEKRREEKLALYEQRRLRLVSLLPEDLDSLDEKLGWLADDPASRMHL